MTGYELIDQYLIILGITFSISYMLLRKTEKSPGVEFASSVIFGVIWPVLFVLGILFLVKDVVQNDR